MSDKSATTSSLEARFWQWFSTHVGEIAGIRTGAEPILDQLTTAIKQVHPDLTFEIGLAEQDRRELVISANGSKAAFPAVQSLVAAAPPLPGWIVIAFRQPKSLTYSIEYEGVKLSIKDIWFSMQSQGQLVGLTLYIRGLTPSNERQMAGASFILLDCVLGEYAVETRIGTVERRPLPVITIGKGLQPLAKLRELLNGP